MRDDIARQLAGIPVSSPISETSSAAIRAVYLPYHEHEPYPGIVVTRDARYGPHERHRLDIFAAQVEGRGAQPIILFVPGGAYVRGDKHQHGTPYHDNVAIWAARHGCIGVTMNYRLAPGHPYPAGAADVAAALRWLRAEAARLGGNPDAVTIIGHSAGAAHAACYASRTDLHVCPGSGANGLVLMAGNYDFSATNPPPHVQAYFGTDPDKRAAAGSVAGVAATNLPVLLVISEFDAPAAHRQTKLLADALFTRDERLANVAYLPGHNHISQLAHLNAAGIDDPLLSDHLAEFIRTCNAREVR